MHQIFLEIFTIFDSRILRTNIFESLWLLECGVSVGSKIRHVKCSQMYLIVILNPKKTKASAEERVPRREGYSGVGQLNNRK